jgi:membrane protease YdiL (CAAX protease family)
MLDVFLSAWLLLGLPALGIARDARTKDRVRSSQMRRWLAAVCLAASASAVLLCEWRWSQRPLELLRLGLPLTTRGAGCLALAAVLLGGLAVAGVRAPPRAAAEEAGLNPRTAREWSAFLVFVVSIGIGWELLFRGFLLYWLSPRTGLAPAVALSSLAYGAAHGVRNPMRFLSALLSALAFTLAAVLSGSLYWLMIIHAGAPLIGAVLLRRSERQERTQLEREDAVGPSRP